MCVSLLSIVLWPGEDRCSGGQDRKNRGREDRYDGWEKGIESRAVQASRLGLVLCDLPYDLLSCPSCQLPILCSCQSHLP